MKAEHIIVASETSPLSLLALRAATELAVAKGSVLVLPRGG